MGSNSNEDNEKVIDSEVFLRELNLTDEQQSILAKVIAVLAMDYAQATLENVLNAVFGDSANDEQNKIAISAIVQQYGNAGGEDQLAEAIYNIMKGDTDDGNGDRTGEV